MNKGGSPINEKQFAQEGIKADLAEIARCVCLEHGGKIIDRILVDYSITPRKTGISRHVTSL